MTVLYFTAPWCRPCRAFGPVLRKAAKAAGVRIIKVNVDRPPKAYKEEAGRLRSVPVLVWVGDRAGPQRLTGVVPAKTLAEWFKCQ